MIKFYKPKGETGAWEGYGKSTDTKPTDDTIPHGSVILDMDTHLIYIYDKPTQTWTAQ